MRKDLDSAPVNVWITDVYFAGGKIYDSTEGDNLVVPDPRSLALNPGSSGTFTFTIPINDELQERVPVDLSDINLGTPIAIKTYLNQLVGPVTYVIEMNPRDLTGPQVPTEFAISETASAIVGAAGYCLTTEEITAAGIFIAAGKGALAGIPATLVGLWLYELKVGLFDPIPPNDPGDNNLIIGG
ncbi:hypothetical protein E3E38_07315 [Thermococcus sp. 18S1]|uniref:hypothetical protein n=1 Tax=Thermococcus sp. 18S1 TaxID=1638210 RepID=UPI00143A4760|nr:hypothetical protein [Thermococcus sp. 18S1]NJE30848.1 hypothetical protein [Thermococcus sp. 18S1]